MEDTHNSRTAFYIKWIASVFQIIGYGATGFGLTPWNLMFLLSDFWAGSPLGSFGKTAR